jgi:hypothetical protein
MSASGVKRTSHKHPFKQCEAAVRQEFQRLPPEWGGKGCLVGIRKWRRRAGRLGHRQPEGGRVLFYDRRNVGGRQGEDAALLKLSPAKPPSTGASGQAGQSERLAANRKNDNVRLANSFFDASALRSHTDFPSYRHSLFGVLVADGDVKPLRNKKAGKTRSHFARSNDCNGHVGTPNMQS